MLPPVERDGLSFIVVNLALSAFFTHLLTYSLTHLLTYPLTHSFLLIRTYDLRKRE
jgi:hypothetical protein